MARKPGSSTGSGRGVRGGGTADKLGRTAEQQDKGGARLLPKDHNIQGKSATTPSFSHAPKRPVKKTLRPGHHGAVKGVKGS